MKKTLAIILAISLLAALFAFPASAAEKTVYINGSAADGGDGTKAKPYKDLVTAMNNLPDGGTVILLGDSLLEAVADASGPTIVKLPETKGTVKVKSEGDNVYKLDMPAAKAGHQLLLNGNLDIDQVEFMTLTVYGRIFLRGYDFTCGSKVVTNGIHYILFGDMSEVVEAKSDCQVVTLNGGLFAYLIFGSNNKGSGINTNAKLILNNSVETEVDGVKTMTKAVGNAITTAVYGETKGDFTVVLQNAYVPVVSKRWLGNYTGNYNLYVGPNAKVDAYKDFMGAEQQTTFSGEFNVTYVDCDPAKGADGNEISHVDAKVSKMSGADYEAKFKDGLLYKAPASEDKPSDKPTSVPTGDPIAIVAVMAVISLAGAVVVKKVR
ncbi:MAG: hypothetical protein E7665_11100 [Ruminococcaceae bacterium]|nr:hypothetical protein [Oscillospiraceae bacterium]